MVAKTGKCDKIKVIQLTNNNMFSASHLDTAHLQRLTHIALEKAGNGGLEIKIEDMQKVKDIVRDGGKFADVQNAFSENPAPAPAPAPDTADTGGAADNSDTADANAVPDAKESTGSSNVEPKVLYTAFVVCVVAFSD